VTFPADPDTVDRLGALRAPMWRALAVFRFAALSYAAALVVWRSGRYEHPAAGWAVLAGMGLRGLKALRHKIDTRHARTGSCHRFS